MKGLFSLIVAAALVCVAAAPVEAHGPRFRATPFRPFQGPALRFNDHHHHVQQFRFVAPQFRGYHAPAFSGYSAPVFAAPVQGFHYSQPAAVVLPNGQLLILQ